MLDDEQTQWKKITKHELQKRQCSGILIVILKLMKKSIKFQPEITCSKLTIETLEPLEEGVKYV